MSSRRLLIALGWVIALALLVAVFSYTFSISDLADFVHIAKSAQPVWLIAMALCELGTYFCVATMYHGMLKALGHKAPLKLLLPLSLEKLVVDQFLPTAGVGGSAIVVHGLKRTGATRQAAIGMVVVGLAAWYCAGDLAGLFGVWSVRDLNNVFPGAIAIFCVYLAISAFIIYVTLIGVRTKYFARIKKILPGKTLDTFFDELAQTHDLGLVTKFGFSKTVLLQLGNILFDGATLFFAFLALGHPVPFPFAVAGYALVNMAATISVLPGGIGVFEGGSVAIFSFFGIEPAVALAATLLYRGFSIWLPLIPGAFFARREIYQNYIKKDKAKA